MKTRRSEVAPCGIYCAACPSFNKTCFGCSSENKKQKRRSKWGCQIRKCCFENKKLDSCSECNLFPCGLINKKLITSHKENPKYTYRHQLSENVKIIKELGIDEFIKQKTEEYTCKLCNGSIDFYSYKCRKCGKTKKIIP